MSTGTRPADMSAALCWSGGSRVSVCVAVLLTLRDLADESLEGQLAQQQISRLLWKARKKASGETEQTGEEE